MQDNLSIMALATWFLCGLIGTVLLGWYHWKREEKTIRLLDLFPGLGAVISGPIILVIMVCIVLMNVIDWNRPILRGRKYWCGYEWRYYRD